MKNTVQRPSIILLAILVLIGCSEKKTTDNADSGKGFASPQALFEAMKAGEDPSGVSLYPPDEQYMMAYQAVTFTRFMVALSQDEAERKAAERAFEELIGKYGLANRLEFTDNEDRMGEMAAKAFEGIDVAAFMADASEFQTAHNPSTFTSEPESGEAVEIELLSMEDLKVEGDEATATLLYSDDTEERFAFVRVDGGWFISLTKTQLTKQTKHRTLHRWPGRPSLLLPMASAVPVTPRASWRAVVRTQGATARNRSYSRCPRISRRTR